MPNACILYVQGDPEYLIPFTRLKAFDQTFNKTSKAFS